MPSSGGRCASCFVGAPEVAQRPGRSGQSDERLIGDVGEGDGPAASQRVAGAEGNEARLGHQDFGGDVSGMIASVQHRAWDCDMDAYRCLEAAFSCDMDAYRCPAATLRMAIDKFIKPTLGGTSLTGLAQLGLRPFEQLYAELQVCRWRCDGRRFIEHAEALGAGCDRRCVSHRCRPLSVSSIRESHAVSSGALAAAM